MIHDLLVNPQQKQSRTMENSRISSIARIERLDSQSKGLDETFVSRVSRQSRRTDRSRASKSGLATRISSIQMFKKAENGHRMQATPRHTAAFVLPQRITEETSRSSKRRVSQISRKSARRKVKQPDTPKQAALRLISQKRGKSATAATGQRRN